MPRPKPRQPDKKRSSGQSSYPKRGNMHRQTKGKSGSNGNFKPQKSNQFPEKYKTIVISLLVAYLAAAVAWVTNAPKEVVWIFILVPVPWIFVHVFPLEERYTKVAEKLIFLFAAGLLITILGFSHQAVIDLENNPKIELIKEFINKLLR